MNNNNNDNNDSNDNRSNKQKQIDLVFKPDSDTGISEWKYREELSEGGLELGSNGAQRHGIFFGDKRYKWEKKSGKRNKTIALRTVGKNEVKLIQKNHFIRDDIREYHSKFPCVVCGQNTNLQCDHKNDLYNDARVLNGRTQTIADFQSLCTHCNTKKRQIAKDTRKTGKRYGGTNIPTLAVFGIDFIEGDETYDENDINAMRGTYWYDPVAFMQHIKNLYKLPLHL
jgi:5-methylcytosine-specific restriction endonuclease McrA|tara:strand:+ start:753 stop:1433 length:681 start_codon:yes stop_codon:yes gene_type:complete